MDFLLIHLDTIKSRYEEIIKGLDLDLSLDDEIAVIAENLKKGNINRLYRIKR